MFILLEHFNFDDKELLKQARFSQFRHFKTQNFLPVGPRTAFFENFLISFTQKLNITG